MGGKYGAFCERWGDTRIVRERRIVPTILLICFVINPPFTLVSIPKIVYFLLHIPDNRVHDCISKVCYRLAPMCSVCRVVFKLKVKIARVIGW